MDITEITYTFVFENRKSMVIPLQFDNSSFALLDEYPAPDKDLVRGFIPCSHCPLSAQPEFICPLADTLLHFIDAFDAWASYESVSVEVDFDRRKIFSTTTIQHGFSSFIGLVIPTCGCPHTMYFRPMARFHLPLSSTDETTYRVLSMFLTAQYFNNTDPDFLTIDIDELQDIYANMHLINENICRFLRQVCRKDSLINAVIELDMLFFAITSSIEKDFHRISHYFTMFQGQPKGHDG